MIFLFVKQNIKPVLRKTLDHIYKVDKEEHKPQINKGVIIDAILQEIKAEYRGADMENVIKLCIYRKLMSIYQKDGLSLPCKLRTQVEEDTVQQLKELYEKSHLKPN